MKSVKHQQKGTRKILLHRSKSDRVSPLCRSPLACIKNIRAHSRNISILNHSKKYFTPVQAASIRFDYFGSSECLSTFQTPTKKHPPKSETLNKIDIEHPLSPADILSPAEILYRKKVGLAQSLKAISLNQLECTRPTSKKYQRNLQHRQSQYCMDEKKLKEMKDKMATVRKQRDFYREQWSKNLQKIRMSKAEQKDKHQAFALEVQLYKQILSNLNHQAAMKQPAISQTVMSNDRVENLKISADTGDDEEQINHREAYLLTNFGMARSYEL